MATIQIDILAVKLLVVQKFKTQRAFAKAVGIREATVSAIMTGKSTPKVSTVRCMAGALEVPPSSLTLRRGSVRYRAHR